MVRDATLSIDFVFSNFVPLDSACPMPELTRTSSTARVASLLSIGNWCAVSLLGHGRWSRVYRARPRDADADSPADYVVKLADPADPQDMETARELLIREVLLGRAVSHPHLVCILSSHLNEAPYYLVMPYLDGVTVELLLEEAGAVSTPSALWIARQTAEALQALHRHGWLHSDIKPSNLLVSDEGHVTLLDLGLARPFGLSGQSRTGLLAGTLEYLPPEAFASVVDLGPAADLYALGVTLYRMLTGRLPFEVRRPSEWAEAHLHCVPPDPRKFNPRLPQRGVQLIAAMLDKQPHRRPSIDELIADLTRLEIETFDQRFAA